MQTQSTNPRAYVQVPERIFLQPTRKAGVFRIELHLETKTVYPGKLDLSGEGFYRCKRKPEHFHRRLNAWGVNAEIIGRYDFRWIVIVVDGKEFITTKEVLLHFGRRVSYPNYEAQWFLPLELWGLDVVREYEKAQAAKPKQLSIFEVAA